jgi:thiol-disulfide isomerase/thioredoxin
MSIYQLTSANFSLTGFQRKSLDINVPGVVLVFFKATTCDGCAAVTPIFNELARVEQSISYASVTVDVYKEIVHLSRQTSAPIMSVPFFILYIDGKPLAKYTGKKDVMSMRSFIVKALQSRPPPEVHQTTFTPQQPPMRQGGGGGGMYGNGGYSHPQMAPGGRGQEPSYHTPEMSNAPNLKNIIKGGASTQYAYLNNGVEEEDDEVLLVPKMVTPHNVPWESAYRKVGTAD